MSMEEIVKSIEDTIKNNDRELYFYDLDMIKVYTTTCKHADELMNDLVRKLENLGIAHDVDEKHTEIWTKNYIISFENIFAPYSRYNDNVYYYVDSVKEFENQKIMFALEIAKAHLAIKSTEIKFDDIVEVINGRYK